MNFFIYFTFLLSFLSISAALTCDPTVCTLPNCRCPSKEIPGNLNRNDIPQFILFSLDDSIYEDQNKVIKNLDFILRNGNIKDTLGCTPKLNFYVRQLETDFSHLSLLQKKAEISLHTYSHTTNLGTTYDTWVDELTTVKSNIASISKIPSSRLGGSRAPYLRTNPNYFQTVYDLKLLYDSSLVYSDPISKQFYWPFTLDYGVPEPAIFCQYSWGECPTSFPGLWEIPLLNFDYDIVGNVMDPVMPDPAAMMQKFKLNFQDSYNHNKAPRGFYWHWRYMCLNDFTTINQEKVDFLVEFYTWLVNTYNDIVFITDTELIEWIKNPKTLTEMRAQKNQHKCSDIVSTPDLNCKKKKCVYGQQSFLICGNTCPDLYPEIDAIWKFPPKNMIPSNRDYIKWTGLLELATYFNGGNQYCADGMMFSHSNVNQEARSFIVTIKFCKSLTEAASKQWSPYAKNSYTTNGNDFIIKYMGVNVNIPANVPFYLGGWCINKKANAVFNAANQISWGVEFYDTPLKCEMSQCENICGNGFCDNGENETSCPIDCSNTYDCSSNRRRFLEIMRSESKK